MHLSWPTVVAIFVVLAMLGVAAWEWYGNRYARRERDRQLEMEQHEVKLIGQR